jgi:recombination protein RecT
MATEPTNLAALQDKQKPRSMQQLEKMQPKARVKAFLEDNRAAIAAALPRHVNADRMLQVAQTAVTQTPALLECHPATLFGALIKCTQLGLEPNSALGQLYLIPFNNKKARRKDVQVIIGYKGMIDLARRSGHIASLQAMAVRAGDDFSFEYGIDEHLRHKPAASRGDITHFYAYAKLVGGGFQFDVLPVEDMLKVMAGTQSQGAYGPWKDHFEAMGRKTMVRRLFNYLPVSIEMAEAQAVDATGDTRPQELDRVLDGEYSVLDDISASDDTGEGADPAEPPRELADANGEIFDPEIHLATASGMPMYNQDDTFRKRPQRAQAVETDPPAVETNPPDQEPPPDQQQEEPPWDDNAQAEADAADAQRGAGGSGSDDDGISVE